MLKKTLLMVLSCAVLTGCASVAPNQNRITFDSNPPGATISDSSGTWGVAPQIRIWTLNSPTAVSNPIVATWVSGAKASIKLNLTAGKDGSWIFQRPQGAPGLDQDVRWAMHIEQQKSREQAETNQMYREWGNSIDKARAERARDRPIITTCSGGTRDMVTCTSM